MTLQRLRTIRVLCVVLLFGLCRLAEAAEYRGQVLYAGQPVPGATVTLVQGNKKLSVVTDKQGLFVFPDAANGSASVEVKMLGFEAAKQDVTIGANAVAGKVELNMLSLDAMREQAKSVTGTVVAAPSDKLAASKPQGPVIEAGDADVADRAAEGMLINGSVNNAATSKYSLAQAFGNKRSGGKALYTGNAGFIFGNSALDAKPYSLSGLDTAKPSYNRVTGLFSIGGPIRIPGLLRNGPNFVVNYQWQRNSTAQALSELVPDALERQGNFSQERDANGNPLVIYNPVTGKPYTGNIPVSPQAAALLSYYPMPNVTGNSRYNYQVPVLNSTHSDALQTRLEKTVGRHDTVFGNFGLQDARASSTNSFGFTDKTNTLGLLANVNWSHRFNQRWQVNLGYRFSRQSTKLSPFWANRKNVSGAAGITGNNQDPTNWGPPTLTFSSGTASLTDGQSAFNRNESNGLTASVLWTRGPHAVTGGLDFRRQEFNYLAQANPRGIFQFTGASTQGTVNGVKTAGSDFADFLIGVPDTSEIAFGNADKYFREPVWDAYLTDDWRVNPQLTVNVGVRWEYGAPITELFGRLVNLDLATGFAAATPVLANSPVGGLTKQHYPSSLINPDKRGIEPRIGISWRPIAGSSIVVRSGYGIYRDTSVYQNSALQMAQQAPLSTSVSVQNSPTCRQTLASGFNACSTTTSTTFGIDPNFRVGYAQTWQASVQADLPAALQMTATYLGIKGTRGVQQFLPNTYPVGGVNPCPSCPLGFTYETSNGNSTRQSGSLQVRRRLRSGLTATLQYTYSKSVDDDAMLGGQGGQASSNTTTNPFSSGQSSSSMPTAAVAQDWRNLSAERGLSTFNQRHLLNLTAQYTSGMGMGGGTLMAGKRGVILKEWTLLTTISYGSGLPETPTYFVAVPGTGVTGTVRGNFTGARVGAAPSGLFLNPAAFVAPAAGQWGSAARGSITGPSQFSLNASLSRTFRLTNRFNLTAEANANNLLNHVAFTSWNTTINSPLFGSPLAWNAMRSLQVQMRLRY